MIIIALGSNMAGPWGTPQATLERAMGALEDRGFAVLRRSRWLRTAPMGPAGQDPYVNGCAVISSHLPPDSLLARLHEIERDAGRLRRQGWGPRTLDIDLIDYHGLVRAPRNTGHRGALVLPHPGIAERAFVLAPIAEIAPFWHHPVTGLTAEMMLKRLPARAPGRILD